MKSINLYKIAQYGTYLLFGLLLTYIAYKSLSDWYLWYDEAGQFYISKGLNHYSEPFAPYSGVADVIYYNRYFNLDPGGFSVLLHYWSMLSNHYVYLRLLPLLFFLVAIFVAYKIGMQLFHAHFPAILLASVFLINPIIVNLAGELRAYSMEMCGVLISLYYLKKIEKDLCVSNLLVLALILDVFMTSRYDFVIFAFAVSLCVIYMIYRQYGFSTKAILPIMLYSCITLSGVALVYFVTMRYQNATAEPLPSNYVLYWGRDFQKLPTHILSRGYYLILGYVLLCHFRKIPQDFYINISFFVCTLYILLSFANLTPWDERRTLAISIIQYLALGLMILRHLNERKIMFAVLLISLCGLYRYGKDGFSIRLSCGDERSVLYKEMKSCVNNLKNKELIYINYTLCPNIRYLFEEYDWNKKFVGVYPSQIALGNLTSHNKTGDKLAINLKRAENIDARFYFVTVDTLSPAQFRLCKGCKYVYEKVSKVNIDK